MKTLVERLSTTKFAVKSYRGDTFAVVDEETLVQKLLGNYLA